MRALHDDGGNVVADLDHDSYGNPEVSVESVTQPYRFTARDFDRDTGLYHYRMREYDPVTGRFLQEDPIWFDSGDMNVYRYTWNNPVMWTDPSGMTALEYSSQNTLSRMMASGAVAAGAVYMASDAERLMQSRSAIQAVGGGIACGFLTIAKALNIVSSGSLVGSIGNCSASEEPKNDGGAGNGNGGGSGNGPDKGTGSGGGPSGGGNSSPPPPPSSGPPPTANQIRKYEQQLSRDGSKSLEKSLRSIESQLREHMEKLPTLKYKSSVEREIRNFLQEIQVIKKLLGR